MRWVLRTSTTLFHHPPLNSAKTLELHVWDDQGWLSKGELGQDSVRHFYWLRASVFQDLKTGKCTRSRIFRSPEPNTNLPLSQCRADAAVCRLNPSHLAGTTVHQGDSGWAETSSTHSETRFMATFGLCSQRPGCDACQCGGMVAHSTNCSDLGQSLHQPAWAIRTPHRWPLIMSQFVPQPESNRRRQIKWQAGLKCGVVMILAEVQPSWHQRRT